MERNYMKPEKLVELDFTTERHMGIHTHENFEMLFVISGKLVITVEEDTSQLGPGDMLVVNVNRKHSYSGSQGLVAGRFLISYTKVRELLGQSHVLFWCNSTTDTNEAYGELRRVIVKLFNQSLAETNRNTLYLNSMYYQMLHLLAENFLLTEKNLQSTGEDGKKGEKEDDRMQEIFAYIRTSYRRNITLQDLAKHLYLSPTYVSRYIKQRCGINFSELLNTVRLGRAMEDLLYTDDSIMKIALDNGFASVAAYNKVFKENHHMTPSEFRKQRRSHRTEKGEEKQQKSLIRQKVEEYLERSPGAGAGEQETGLLELDARVDLEAAQAAEWDGYCCRLINGGTAMDLLNSTFQNQILSHRTRLGFEYVRFWDVCAPELCMDIHAGKGCQNYSRLNAVTDFLVGNRLKPYMDLGFKPLRILRTTGKALKEVERKAEFGSEEEMRRFYRELIRNFIDRYGSEEVQTWYFEYWEDTNVSYLDMETYHFTAMAEKEHKNYFHCFGIIAEEFRKCLPQVRIGGGGFPVRLYGENGFAQILTVWKQERELPDFISLSCYPYIQEQEKNAYYEKRNTDMRFVLHNIEMAERAVEAADFPVKELHVSEYSLSLSNRNIINDSCLKGAFLVYNAIACLGKGKLMGHWLFTDAYAELKDTQSPLFGGCGLLTRDGITKPSYFAMEFFNRLYRKVLVTHPNYIVTRSDRGSLRLVCHNMKKMNYNYYISEEDAVGLKDLQLMLENREYLTIHFQAVHMADGSYSVKRNRLSQTMGSVQDKWCGLNMEPNLTMREMDYLKAASTSAISIEEVQVKEGRLELDILLEPNEIQYIHILAR